MILANGGPYKTFTGHRHFGIKLNYIMEQISNKKVKLRRVNSERMSADFMTKQIAPKDFEETDARVEIILFGNLCNVLQV